MRVRRIRLNLLERVRVKQAGGYRIVKNLGFAVQKLVDCSKRGDAKSSPAGVTLWFGPGHGLSLQAGNARRFRPTLLLYFHWLPLLARVPQRRENTRLQNFRLGSHPVFQLSSFDLSTLIVKLVRAQPYFSLQQFHHQFLPFTSSYYAVHC